MLEGIYLDLAIESFSFFVSSVLSLLFRRLYLLRRDLSLLVLASWVPASLALFLLGPTNYPPRTKAGHECHEGCHGLRLFLAEVAGEPFVTDAVFEGC